jgi:serine acetyltransferase
MSFLYAKFGKALVVGEVAVLGATYYIYHQVA